MRTPEQRFWPKVNRLSPGECWTWSRTRNAGGYGQFWLGTKMVPAHRFAYELLVGPIPDGLQIDHLCRNTACVNPAHLEPVTPRENTHRGTSAAALNAKKTHCIHGHEFSPENTKHCVDGGKKRRRRCKECKRIESRQRRVREARMATSGGGPR